MPKSKEEYNAYMKEYMLRRYHERRSDAIRRLGGVCVNCESTENLELDHVDRKSKTFDLGGMWSVSEERYLTEVQKCQLLCRACHEKKTLKDFGRVSAKTTHGTISSYRYCKCAECKTAKKVVNQKYVPKRKLLRQLKKIP